MRILKAIYYSFPLQLFLNNLRRNHVLVLCWILLLAMVTGAFGKHLGIPYLFLDPEYLSKVNFMSFFTMGSVLGGLMVAFNITCYINDGHRFSFIGTLRRPFAKFALNNSLIPLAFLGFYVQQIIQFQVSNQYSSERQLFFNLLGLFSGLLAMIILSMAYFWLTNKDIFRYVVCRLDEKLKENVRVTRASAMNKLDIARKKQVRVDNYLGFNFRFKKVDHDKEFYDRQTVLQVFDQNHFNLVIIELFLFAVVIALGFFKDIPAFQLPAAASVIIFLTLFVMLAGAFSYWFGGWSGTAALVVFLIVNYLSGQNFFSRPEKAFGLDYSSVVDYSNEKLRQLSSPDTIARDKKAMMVVLNNWRAKFPESSKPKMVFICVSGGGKRAALWALTVMQAADSLSNGKLMEQSIMITGASGGLIGASYYRELKLREKLGQSVNPYSSTHRVTISADNLNPLIFSFLANGIFVGLTRYEFAGHSYVKDRAYTFERELDEITGHLMDKPLSAYEEPERKAMVPLIILSPVIINDGRKLYISSQPTGYMNAETLSFPGYDNEKISGVDFRRLFQNQNGDQLRFLSALRMSATFPYITPNTTLPTNPPIEIMDAGVADNFGISNAVRFLYAFRDWIGEHTSGVVILSIRDSPKLWPIAKNEGQTIVDNVTQPISSIYNNLENFQDISNDAQMGHSVSWLKCPLFPIDVQYQADSYLPILGKMDSIRQTSARASLSWHLTRREKQNIVDNIHTARNRKAIESLMKLIE